MTKLVYDNIFESIEQDEKKAARMHGAADALIDLRTVLEERGMRTKKAKSIIRALQDLVFSRYR
jgi:hypothetical protein